VSPRRFEGPDLEKLLASVRQEMGPNVRIVEANKVRSGGVGGFFSRERFEVFADADAAAPVAMTSPAPAPAPAAMAAVEATAAPTTEPATSVAVADHPVAAAAPTPEYTATSATAAGRTTQARDLLELADLVSAVEARRQPAASDGSFASMYAKASADVHAVLEAENTTTPEGADAVVAAATVATPTIDAPDEPSEPVEPSVTPAHPFAAHDTPINAPEHPPVETMTTSPTLTNSITAPTTPPSTPTTPPASWPSEAGDLGPVAEAPLLRLGLPVELVPPVIAGRDLRQDLIERLAALPSAPRVPSAPGSVVCFVGTDGSAVAAARRAAIETGANPDDVVLAQVDDEDQPPWLVVTDPETAATRRRGWWRRPEPTFVAIEQRTRTAEAWTVAMLAALEPTLVVGTASAATKPDDLAAWAAGLALDGLELDHLDATISPATAIASGVPILRLEGELATPALWADVLIARLGR